MLNKPRVAPKNIQFKNNVQIRVIPRTSVDTIQSTKGDSWDPNLNDKDIFKEKPTKQRNVIIIITVCGCVLIGIILGAVLGVIFSQKTSTVADQSLTYNQACRAGSNQCISSEGLSCPNGFCSCTSPNSWNQVTTSCTLLTYNQACSTSSQCNSSLGLMCTNQMCQCDSYHSWNSTNNTCVIILNNTLTYGNTCANGSAQCNSTVDLTCTGTCTCQNSKIWNITNCVCPAGTFLNSSNLCQTAFQNNVSCLVGSNQCDSTKGLTCYNTSNSCQCDPSYYWNINYLTCLLRVNYSYSCSADSDCVPTLICPRTAYYCNCPLYLPDAVCNCANTTYYDSSISQCVNRGTFNSACIPSTNYTCLSTLYCNAGICACPTGTSWIVANSTCA